MQTTATSCGFVAIVGAPNAGKSTLLNTLIGQKLAATSAKPQTTRTRILGIMTAGKAQICLLDTPGIFLPKEDARLDRAMVGAAWQVLGDADIIMLMVDAERGYDGKTRRIVEQLQDKQQKAVLLLNKVDLTDKLKILPLTEELSATGIFTEIFMIAAKHGDGIGAVKKYLAKSMPPGPWMFDPDQITDMPASLVASEITREQLYHQLAQELPYAATVIPTAWEDRKDGSVKITQRIIVARDGQKAIIIGKGGAQLKDIGVQARLALEKMLGRKVHLFLEVAVEPEWQSERRYYTMFGLDLAPPGKK